MAITPFIKDTFKLMFYCLLAIALIQMLNAMTYNTFGDYLQFIRCNYPLWMNIIRYICFFLTAFCAIWFVVTLVWFIIAKTLCLFEPEKKTCKECRQWQ